MRLAKRMAQLGICSRREADGYIVKGWVKVNGEVTFEKGLQVTENDRITLNQLAQQQQSNRVTILLNKPVGYVSAQPEKGYKAAAELITPQNQWTGDKSNIRYSDQHKYGLAPAGRLDIDSVGLLVLTQDGVVAKQLIGETTSIEKEYLVRVTGKMIPDGLGLLNHGLSLDGEKLRPAKVTIQNEDQLRFILRQGKKRQIRRMCELVGLHVTGLKRIRMGNVRLGELPPGKWRYLRGDEGF
jgi:23S rRNA pseudouridine2604 synthase